MLRLEQRGVAARLAGVGDRVDFVVTLAEGGELSSGRLERQTSEGTIALRQVEDARCEAVADALALSLALTHDPEAEAPAPAEPEPRAPNQNPAPPVEPAPPAATATRAEPTEAPQKPESFRVALGVAGQASDVFEGAWLLSVGPFAELVAPRSFVLPHATLRLALNGGFRADDGASVAIWLAGARLDGCPIGLVVGSLALRPCVAVDAGAIGASAAGISDVGGWFALAAHARAELALGPVALEAQAGGLVPVTQYEVMATSSAMTLEKTRAVGFSAGVGASYRFE